MSTSISTGKLSVEVGGQTATSLTNFTVALLSIITNFSYKPEQIVKTVFKQ